MKLFRLTALIAFVIAFATTAKARSWPPLSDQDCYWMNRSVDNCYYQCAGRWPGEWLRAKNAECPGFGLKGASCLSMKKSLEGFCWNPATWAGSFWRLKPIYKKGIRVRGIKEYSAPKVR